MSDSKNISDDAKEPDMVQGGIPLWTCPVCFSPLCSVKLLRSCEEKHNRKETI